MRKALLSLFIILAVFITSCTPGGSVNVGAGNVTTYHNNEIDNETLDSLKILDDTVLESIRNNDADKILEISSETFKKNSGNIKEAIDNAKESIKDKSLEYKDRYYCKVSKIGNYSFSIDTLQDDPFYINLQAISGEIFVSLIKSNSQSDDFMLSLIYVKEQGKWKLSTLYGGGYSYAGMNAIDLYEKAKSLDTQGYKLPAALYATLSNRLLRPAPFLQYKNENEITNYNKELLNSLKENYTFPQQLQNNNTIKIYGFDVEYFKEGIVPIVKYTTNIEMGKSEELQKEANDMNKEATDKYSGLKENFKYILYEAYSEPPVDPKATYKYYRTKVEQK